MENKEMNELNLEELDQVTGGNGEYYPEKKLVVHCPQCGVEMDRGGNFFKYGKIYKKQFICPKCGMTKCVRGF